MSQSRHRPRPVLILCIVAALLYAAFGSHLHRAAPPPPQKDASGIPYMTDDLYADAISGAPLPLFLEIGTKTCSDCLLFDPELQRIQSAWSGRLAVYKVDAEKDPLLARRFGVTGYPTLVIAHRGRTLATHRGGFFHNVPGPVGADGTQYFPLAVDENALWKWIGDAEAQAASLK